MSYLHIESIALCVFSSVSLRNRVMLSCINKKAREFYILVQKEVSDIAIEKQFRKVFCLTGNKPENIDYLNECLFRNVYNNLTTSQQHADNWLRNEFFNKYGKLYKSVFSKYNIVCNYVQPDTNGSCRNIAECMDDNLKRLLSCFGLSCDESLYCKNLGCTANVCKFPYHMGGRYILHRTLGIVLYCLQRMHLHPCENFIFENIHEWIVLYDNYKIATKNRHMSLLYNTCKTSVYYKKLYMYEFLFEESFWKQKISRIYFEENILSIAKLLVGS